MGQTEVLNFLRRHKGNQISIVELCAAIPSSNRSNISHACKKLRELKQIKFKQIKQGPFTRYMYYV